MSPPVSPVAPSSRTLKSAIVGFATSGDTLFFASCEYGNYISSKVLHILHTLGSIVRGVIECDRVQLHSKIALSWRK